MADHRQYILAGAQERFDDLEFIQVAQLGFISRRGQADHVVDEILKGQGAVTGKVFGTLYKCWDGNASDNTIFRERSRELIQQALKWDE